MTSTMKWVSIAERKPKKSGIYFWKGDSNYGGIDYFDAELKQFLIGDYVPVNAISDDNLYWLDEEVDDFESISRLMIEYLCENHHPHVTVIITPTSAELLEGKKAIYNILDFLKD